MSLLCRLGFHRWRTVRRVQWPHFYVVEGLCLRCRKSKDWVYDD